MRARRALGPFRTSEAVITAGFELRAKYVTHAMGPVWRGGTRGEAALLDAAYDASFSRAREAGDVRPIAFPAISTGVYGYPKEPAAEIALRAMQKHEVELVRIIACKFDAESAELYRRTMARS